MTFFARHRRLWRWLTSGLFFSALLSFSPLGLDASALRFDAELGAAFAGDLRVRAPKLGGTPFSLQDDFYAGLAPFFRLQASWEITRRHTVFALAAPLRLSASGLAPNSITLSDHTFAQGEPLWANYRADTYRLGYLFTLIDAPAFLFKIGLSSRFRSGAVKLNGVEAKKVDNADIRLPGLSLALNYFIGDGYALLFEGDALVFKGGCACDLFAGVLYDIDGRYSLRAGWRIMLESKDTAAIYAKSRINHFTLGGGIRL